MEFLRATNPKQIEMRQEEIINACDNLFTTGDYDSVTIRDIASMTSISRPSIYTYYKTKEEILLDVLKREYFSLTDDLTKEFDKYKELKKEEYCKILTTIFFKHNKFLRLSSIHFTNIEKNCSLEKLTEFSTDVQIYFETLFNSFDKFFPNTDEQIKNEFSFCLQSFINGIYPLLHLTYNQIQSLKVANPSYKVPDEYKTVYNGILLLMGTF